MKQLKYSLAMLLFTCSAEATKVTLDMSFYGPERCGLRGVQTVTVSNMEDEPSRAPIRLDDAMPPVKSTALAFDRFEGFVLQRPGYRDQPLSEDQDRQVRERISALTTSTVTARFFGRSLYTLNNHRLLPHDVSLRNLSLTITPHDTQCGENAAYTRVGSIGGRGTLKYCSQGFDTVQIFDVNVHETWHALFDAVNPAYYTAFTSPLLSERDSLNHPYRVVHETVGDMGAIYTSCDIAIVQDHEEEVEAFLKASDFCMASGWMGEKACLRTARSYSPEEGCEAHNMSVLLTNLLVNTMRSTYAGVLKYVSCPVLSKPRTILQNSQRLLTTAIAKAPSFRTLKDFGKVLQDTQEELNRTHIACVDDFSEKSYSVDQRELNLFKQIAANTLKYHLESELGEELARCGG